MAHSESEDTNATTANTTAAVALTTRAGTHIFTPRDRLWVLDGSDSISRPVVELRPGDLIAFLGRVKAVRLVANGTARNTETAAPQNDSAAHVPSIAA
jgi:hypothetical protein